MSLLFGFLRSVFRDRRALLLENLALRQQLAVCRRTRKRPALRTADRVFWVWLSKLWPTWSSALVIVKPQIVLRWHRQGFKLCWRWRSRPGRPGRPTITAEHIAFIKRLSRDNPSWARTRSTTSCASSSASATPPAQSAST